MSRKRRAAFLLLAPLFAAGCIDIGIPGEEMLFTRGTSFVVSGTVAVVDNGGPCLVWIAENGVTYHLFQGVRVDNDDFDRVTTPGTTSRLEIATRSDLVVTCRIGTIVEVQSVLEIVE